jgi:hypothetical protein
VAPGCHALLLSKQGKAVGLILPWCNTAMMNLHLAAISADDLSDIEIWFADEARVGQKNKITRRWARRGSRPSAPSDQRTAST